MHDTSKRIAANTKITKGTEKDSYFNLRPSSGDPKGGDGYVSFDVALSASNENKKGGEGGIKIAVVNLGGKAEHAVTESQVSRIKFVVGIKYFIQ